MDNSEKQELISVIRSGWFTEAKKTKKFESEFCKFVGCKYACAVTSGTSGLYIALKAAGIKKNDEVIVPNFTFVASPNSIEEVGAKPILVDIEKKSLNLDLKLVEKSITKKTKAIMPVDFNGRSCDMKKLRKIAKKNNLFLIEDAAHGLGCFHDKKHVGLHSDIAVFSFSTPKIITTGQGGMIITNKKIFYEKCKAIKDFGRKPNTKQHMRSAFEHSTIGYNYKFTEFQAAVGLAQMRKLRKRIKIKKNMFERYRKLLNDIPSIEFLQTNLKSTTPWMVDIILKNKTDRDDLIDFLDSKNIETRIFYPPIHKLGAYSKNNLKFVNTEQISDRGLWLPSSVTLKPNQIDIICKYIRIFFKTRV